MAKSSKKIESVDVEVDFVAPTEYKITQFPQNDRGPNAGRYRAGKFCQDDYRPGKLETHETYGYGDTQEEAIKNCEKVERVNRARHRLNQLDSLFMRRGLVPSLSNGNSEYDSLVRFSEQLNKFFETEVLGSKVLSDQLR